MEIDDLPQEQASHIIVTTDLILKAQEQVSLLQALKAVRDRLLATLGVKDLESPPRSAAKTASEPPAHNGSWTVETESQDGPVEGPVQGLAFTNRPDSSDRLWLSDDTSEVRAWIDAHPVQYKQTPRHNLLSDSLDQLTLEDSAPLPPEPLPCSLKEDLPDATLVDCERGRSRKRQSPVERQKAKGPSPFRRRPASPDWNVVLGEPDPSFVPDHGYFCSRCLRRVPEANRRHTAKQVSAVENEYKVRIEKTTPFPFFRTSLLNLFPVPHGPRPVLSHPPRHRLRAQFAQPQRLDSCGRSREAQPRPAQGQVPGHASGVRAHPVSSAAIRRAQSVAVRPQQRQ